MCWAMGVFAVLLLSVAWVIGVFARVFLVTLAVGMAANLDWQDMGRFTLSAFFVVTFGGEALFLVYQFHRLGRSDYVNLAVLAAMTIGLCRRIWHEGRERRVPPHESRRWRKPRRRTV